uniref:SDR family NAD(P)-dependent oxidoreductase n=1 Tax=Paenibacillus durus TaxID=44251 RepID=UPI000693C3BF|nr:SDR family NAD(P)-dependent oxidoreductase [Paenibacillus durus]
MKDDLYQMYKDIKAHKINQHDAVSQLTSLMSRTVKIQNNSERKSGNQIDKSLFDKVLATIVEAVSGLLKVNAEEIEADVELGEYGLDSIMLTELTNTLNRDYQMNLTPALFFEYPTLQEFTEYVIRTYRHVFTERFSEKERLVQAQETITKPVSTKAREASLATKHNRFARFSSLHAQENRTDGSEQEAIAIVGMSGIFPMAANTEELWKNLLEGRDCISEIPPSRWDWRAHYGDPLKEANKTNIKWGGFIEGVDEFDPGFFGISPREAELMDPQQRLLMLYVWKTIEDAGYSAQSLSGSKLGLFVGTSGTGYSNLIARSSLTIEGYTSTGIVPSVGPNRMSYFLNVHGPSEPIETACSSSLVAIHRAVTAMKNGDCDAAIVGGINTILTPEGHISLNKAGMLSEDGRCRTFSEQANGYVRSEGAGMLMIKRLKDAEQAGDHIYGLIRGTNENHGGRANSLTAPNPKAQAELLSHAYRKAGIDPRTVGYIETHGTGTPLGDPIEVNGLKASFRELYQATGDERVKEAHCGLGSVKTNIGHLEMAAGIAGVIKVLLQMKYKKLVPNLHLDTLNPYIQLEGSPFYLVWETREWKTITDENGKEMPRRAGVSSFGFGGVNAHIIIEEYRGNRSVKKTKEGGVTPERPAMIVLSAKNGERLKEQARQLLEAVRQGKYENSDMEDIAYTLQVGREAMEERLGILAGTMEELKARLSLFVEGKEENGEGGGLYRGQVKRGKDALLSLTSDEEMQEVVSKWLQRGKYGKVLELWTTGFTMDWAVMYGDDKPSRISLPTYPFARERYWVPLIEAKERGAFGESTTTTKLHPLVHRNTSDLNEQRYSSTFTGMETFLRGSKGLDSKQLPDAAHLEMARAAVQLAVQGAETDINVPVKMQLRDIKWVNPAVVAKEPLQVHIGLYPKEDGTLIYEIYGETGTGNSEIFSQGLALPTLRPEKDSTSLDLTELMNRCTRRRYAREQFEAKGDTSTRLLGVIQQCYWGYGEVLVKLASSNIMLERTDMLLHPELLNAVIQMGVDTANEEFGAFSERETAEANGLVAMKSLELLSGGQIEWAWIRYNMSTENYTGHDLPENMQGLDIALVNEAGHVCVWMRGVTLCASEACEGLLLLEPDWQDLEEYADGLGLPVYHEHRVLLCESVAEGIAELSPAGLFKPHCVRLGAAGDITHRFEAYAMAVFEEIREQMKKHHDGINLLQVVTSGSGESQLVAGLVGLLRTARLENPQLTGQLIEIEAGTAADTMAEQLQACAEHPEETHLRIIGGRLQRAGWREYETEGEQKESNTIENTNENENKILNANIYRKAILEGDVNASTKEVKPQAGQGHRHPWKDGGVYVITGGGGGLGRIFAEEITRRAQGTTLILTGRSASLPEAVRRELERLSARVIYEPVDVADAGAVKDVMKRISQLYGRVNGILHSAGVTRDSLIRNKTVDEWKEVLASKVTGTVNLDEASREEELDLLILFSSGAGVTGNIGQADYAAANAFMDRYAQHRNDLVKAGERRGRTLSVNWPLWEAGGMQMSEVHQRRFLEQTGLRPLRTEAGLEALYRGLASSSSQVLVAEGDLPKLRHNFLSTKFQTISLHQSGVQTENAETDWLTDKVRKFMAAYIAELLKVNAEEIEADVELGEYGLDSIMLTELTNTLNRDYQMNLTPALFFEYPTLQEFTEYVIRTYRHVFTERFSEKERLVQAQETITKPVPTKAREASLATKNNRFAGFSSLHAQENRTDGSEQEAVAIVGMSGIFPMAANTEELWKNLLEGRDCISEIPPSRWDWRAHYGDPLKEANKTNIKWGGFIEGVDEFDPGFFGISPREAELMDPQQRLLMLYVWKTIEDAGYSAQSLSGSKLGLFVGTSGTGYSNLIARSSLTIEGYTSTGIVPSVGPNRMSYFLNVHGPSEPIETACSSSLVAIHRAVTAMKNGDCDAAIVGGINTILTPEGHISLNKAGMLSEDGRCRTFSEQANGYVRSEGAGMLMIKRLKDAEQAGDHIYGLIRGTNENHGGRANSLTAPNPKAQAELLSHAYRKAGIDPRTVGYIETHGTGTPLGDPIEVNGLKASFRELYQATGDERVKEAHCGLGSVKTNIGHLEMAAGIAGVIKVLLQMKYKKLVPNLHLDTLNPYIQLEGSPFYLVWETREWKTITDENGKEMPRRAGVSSFGFGGVNAHIIIEEYRGNRSVKKTKEGGVTPERPAMIVLSAKNGERLKEQARQLLEAVRQGKYENSDMEDIAYTLQVGREAMEERLGILAGTMEELKARLSLFVEGKEENGEGGGLYRGQVKRGKDALLSLTSDEEMQEVVSKWLQRGKYGKVLELWTTGFTMDWAVMYGDDKPSRISLPTYPFARERYWVPLIEAKERGAFGESTTTTKLHPLVHRNTSDLNEQRYSSTFTGMETFLRGSKGLDSKQLPDAAHLEMARAAVQLAVQGAETDINVPVKMQLRDIKWVNPAVVAKEPLQVHIGLYPEEDGTLRYELFSRTETVGEEVVWSQGSAFLDAAAQKEEQPLNVAQIMERCRRIEPAAEQGHIQGHTQKSPHWPMEQYYLGAGEALVKLPRSDAALKPQGLVLDPQLLDAAIQAAADVTNGTPSRFHAAAETKTTASSKLVALESLDILSGGQAVWAWIRTREDTTELAESHAYEKTRKFDITLCDDAGQICFCIDGLQLREEEQQELGAQVAAAAEPNRTEATRLMTFEEVWEEANDAPQVQTEVKTLVCLLSGRENQEALRTMLARRSPQTQVAFIAQPAPEQDGIHAAAGEACQTAFRCIRQEHEKVDVVLYLWPLEDPRCLREPGTIVQMLQAMAAEQVKPDRVLLAGEYTEGIERCYLDAWIGFERSLGLILPQTRLTVISRQAQAQPAGEAAWSLWPDLLWNELHTSQPQSVRYENGQRKVSLIRPVSPAAEPLPDSYGLKTGGTYLITGGLGGLGLVFARAWAPRGVNLILMGRSALDSAKQKTLEELEAAGSRSMYVQADVSEAAQVEEGLRGAKERFGAIYGLVHAAGVESRVSVLAKKAADFERVLSPKIQGTLVLEEALRAEPLAFRCYFSSSSALLGDFGSCDYAVANRFQMAYAQEQSREGSIRTVAINWPLWREGGMGAGEEEGSGMYLKTSGQRFLEKDEGVGLFEKIMREPHAQQLVMAGQPSRVHRFLGITAGPEPVKEAQQAPRKDKKPERRRPELRGKSLTECVQWELKELAGRTLKLKKDLIDPEENLAEFGFDSISLTEFALVLSRHYGIELTPAVFFGHSTLNKLTLYLVQTYPNDLTAFYAEEASVRVPGEEEQPAVPKPTYTQARLGTRFPGIPAYKTNEESIAIIGMSGKFPQATTIEQLWGNIQTGTSCISKIPRNRWGIHANDQDSEDRKVPDWGGYISDIDRFDPLFFQISPNEASMMDPRQRLFLEEAWHAFEDAGYMGDRIRGQNCGVYVGVEEGEYGYLAGEHGSINGNQNATLAARIAYALDLKGPNMAITAACSSGLVALHQACQALRNGECQIALAGAVSLILSSMLHAGLAKAGMLSPDGQCRVFDERANGLVPGEAVTAVFLKPLSQAIKDGDRIYGSIKGSGVNYSGKTNGLTAPNPEAQADLMKRIYKKYQIKPEEIQLIMAQSVGSKIGDAIEMQALAEAFGPHTDLAGYCTVGSVKPLIGHTFAASGLVSLIVLLMAMKHKTLPALHLYEQPNRYIDMSSSPFVFNQENKPWQTQDNKPRLGAVSTTGISGTNAHVVIEEYCLVSSKAKECPKAESAQIIVLSAHQRERLQAVVQQMLNTAILQTELSLSDIAYTLQTGREALPFRLALVVNNKDEFIAGLKDYLKSEKEGSVLSNTIPVFKGQVQEEDAVVQELLSGPTGEKILQALIADNCLDKVALYWAKGGKVSWEAIHGGERAELISLPGYPFEKRRCWIETLQEKLPVAAKGSSPADQPIRNDEGIIAIVTNLLGLCREEMNMRTPLVEYGMDSIVFMQMVQRFQTQISPEVNAVDLQGCVTIMDIVSALSSKLGYTGAKKNFPLNSIEEKGAILPKKTTAQAWLQFPELIRLNEGIEGRPVFWFHAALGGVEGYQVIASQSQRPFYGIQARGWMTDRSPLHGIQSMAMYYLHLIQIVQPDGPYDLGGYSLGGLIAYEVSRQLQLKGEVVNSIVMLDSLHLSDSDEMTSSDKGFIFQSVNMSLLSTILQTPEKVPDTLIHRDDVNLELENEVFLKELIAIAKTRGLSKSESRLQELIEQCVKVQQAYQADQYEVLPLPNREAVTCYYFRNKNGQFFGELEPYFVTEDDRIEINNKAYWEVWEQQIPGLHIIDVDSSNHMMLLSEKNAYDKIAAFCKQLYSGEGMNEKFMKSFKTKINKGKSSRKDR